MKKLVLGIGCFGHDSSVSLVDESGSILFCLTEERFSNKKHDGSFPTASIKNICEIIESNNLGRIEYIAINFAPNLYIEDKLFSYIDYHCNQQTSTILKKTILDILPDIHICTDILHTNSDKIFPMNYIESIIYSLNIEKNLILDLLYMIRNCINKMIFANNLVLKLKNKFPQSEIVTIPHHKCHAASTFFCSGFKKSAIMTIDGYGEYDTITLGYGEGKDISVISKSSWPNSIGLLYSMMSSFLGFNWFGDEYKVMGMAAYGEAKYLHLFEKLGDISENGEFKFRQSELIYRNEVPGLPGEHWLNISPILENYLGGKKNKNDEFIQRHFDIAASLQKFIEQIGVKMAKYLKSILPKEIDSITISGGVGLNGLLNQAILKEAGFEYIFIQPASSDDGTSLGGALTVVANKYKQAKFTRLDNAFLGLDYSSSILKELDEKKLNYEKIDNLPFIVAKLLSEGNVVARYEGRSEFGPRALGHRSILANPQKAEMKDLINSKIKHREEFRPFAPVCLKEEISNYFDVNDDAEYMLLICKVKDNMKNKIPAVVHKDGTARVQSVSKEKNSDLYKIIEAFKELTNVPVIINTSFNVNGETIVETPQDAIECFLYTDIDYLAIGDYLVSKNNNLNNCIKKSTEDFLNLRKERYLKKYNSPELYWSLDIHPFSFSKIEIAAQNKRLLLNESFFKISQKAINSKITNWTIVSMGELGSLAYNILSNYINIERLVDKNINLSERFEKPIMKIEEAIKQGSRNFIITSEFYEKEIISEIKDIEKQLNFNFNILSLKDVR